MLNVVHLIGNLGADPEVRYTQSGTAVANISLACTERWKDKSGQQQEHTEWVKVVVFGRLAEVCSEYLHKGSRVYFQGKMQTKKWQDQNGNDRWTTEVIAKEMKMLGGKSGGSRGQEHDIPDSDEDVPF